MFQHFLGLLRRCTRVYREQSAIRVRRYDTNKRNKLVRVLHEFPGTAASSCRRRSHCSIISSRIAVYPRSSSREKRGKYDFAPSFLMEQITSPETSARQFALEIPSLEYARNDFSTSPSSSDSSTLPAAVMTILSILVMAVPYNSEACRGPWR